MANAAMREKAKGGHKAVSVSPEVHQRLRENYAKDGTPVGYQAEAILRKGLGLPPAKPARSA